MVEGRLINRHIPVLDGLRGLAIIAVIVCHVNWSYGGPFLPGRINGPLAAAFGWGWVGVDLFFVLSGFLITGILYDAKGCDGYFRNFYARRTLRIMPLYFGFLIFIVVLSRLGCSSCHWITRDDAVSLGFYLYNFRVAISHKALDGLHHFWSLAVEEHFYLVWPFAVWAFSRRSLMRLCVAVASISFLLRVIVVLSGSWPLVGFFVTPCRVDGLLAGSMVALAWRDHSDWAQLRRWAGRLALGSGCLLVGIALGQRHFLPEVDIKQGQGAVDASLVLTIGIAALATFFSGLIVLAVEAPLGSRLRRLLECNGLRAFGKYSYAIYVLHGLILSATVQLTSPLLHVPSFIAKPVTMILVSAASFAVAWISYHLYEKHFLRLKRFFEYQQPVHLEALVSSQCVSYSNA